MTSLPSCLTLAAKNLIHLSLTMSLSVFRCIWEKNPINVSLGSFFRRVISAFVTTLISVISSDCSSWARISPIFWVYCLWSLQRIGKSLMACLRIYKKNHGKIIMYKENHRSCNFVLILTATSVSSHKSKWASIAWLVSAGKLLKNFAINCAAKRFSLSDPFTAANISKYSFSCCNQITISKSLKPSEWKIASDKKRVRLPLRYRL